MPQGQGASSQLSLLAEITDRITTRNMKRNQEISRLALGEISNRVSNIQLEDNKNQVLKAGVQQIDKKLTRQTVKAHLSSKLHHNADNKQTSQPEAQSMIVTAKQKFKPGKVELFQSELPLSVNIELSASGTVLGETDHNVPMDISGDGRDAHSKSLFLQEVNDIDKDGESDPQLVSIYVNSVYSYMRHLEKKFSVRKHFLRGTEITGKMRAVLIDWLCRVHYKFQLLQETFYLTVAIVDRYLQVKPCRRSKLQLVGVTSMLVASKYEEMYAPEVGDFVYITDDAYTKEEIRKMEQDILRSLDYSLGRPHCLHFLRRNSKAGEVSTSVHTLAKYLMELAAVEYEMVHIAPSLIAAAAIYLSFIVLNESSWTPTLQFYSSYSVNDIIHLVHSLAHLVIKAETSKLTAVKTKYSSSQLMSIALIPQLKSPTLLKLASAHTPQR